MKQPRLLIATLALAACQGAPRTPSTSQIQRSAAAERAPTPGPAATFTGRVMVTPLFEPTPERHAGGASVSFEPGARSAWHSHPAGQTLVVTAGTGWIQQRGGARLEMQAGDVIWTPPGVEHWHGATASTAVTHLALQEARDGKVVQWLAHVTDAEYAATE